MQTLATGDNIAARKHSTSYGEASPSGIEHRLLPDIQHD